MELSEGVDGLVHISQLDVKHVESVESVVKEGDEIEVNLAKGEIKNLTSKMIYHAQPFPEFMQKLIKAGGLISYIKKKLKS